MILSGNSGNKQKVRGFGNTRSYGNSLLSLNHFSGREARPNTWCGLVHWEHYYTVFFLVFLLVGLLWSLFRKMCIFDVVAFVTVSEQSLKCWRYDGVAPQKTENISPLICAQCVSSMPRRLKSVKNKSRHERYLTNKSVESHKWRVCWLMLKLVLKYLPFSKLIYFILLGFWPKHIISS